MLNVWTQPSGYTFTNNGAPFQEQIAMNYALPVTTTNGITFKIISGGLPGGITIVNGALVGTPFAVSSATNYTFCIRASSSTDFADRTFNLVINGANPPEFITSAGKLPVGPAQQLYALDGTYVSYQIEAFDINTSLGNVLRYFIETGDGALPKGLTLSDTGLISGYIEPQLILTASAGTGEFDQAQYDNSGYDFALIPTDGFDSYQYDDVFFDYNLPSVLPKSLNANYQFRVTVTDGINYAQRVFSIFVLGNDQFRADSTSTDGFAGGFTSDSTFLRTPVWMSDTNLGIYRANNYLTVPIVLYDNTDVIFRLETTNCEVYAVTKRVTLADNIAGSYSVTVTNASKVPTIGQYFTFDNYISGADETKYQIASVANLNNGYYRLTISKPLQINLPELSAFYIGSLSVLPTGTNFDIETGTVYGTVPYQPAITKTYSFTITATRFSANINDQVVNHKTFNLIILGSITSQITWTSPGNLGTIPAAYPSTLRVSATTNVPNGTLLYNLTSGSLPPGLSLALDGEIVGTPNQFYNASTGELGLTTFDGGTCVFDFSQTTTDLTYTFTVTASDQYQYSSLPKTFTISLSTPNTVAYSNIIAQPFLSPSHRTAWKSFINNPVIFTPNDVYRIDDPNFGIQSNLTMLVYAGIETEAAAAYVGAMGLGFKRKQFKFGDLKTAIATDPVSGDTVYEVVYIQMIDPREPNGKAPAASFQTASVEPSVITVDESIINAKPLYNITVDSQGYQTSNPHTKKYFNNSITNWQNSISKVGLTERNYLPLWMRSIPTGQKAQLGYVLCVPICFCKPGTSNNIYLNIKNNGFNFNSIDYTIDRFTISAVTGYTSDKYLMFRNDRITV
jgi:Putative Ig domain